MTTTLEISCVTTGGQDGKTMSILPGNASPEEIASALRGAEADMQSSEDELFQDLLMASIKRVETDLGKASCQKDFKNASATIKRLSSVGFSDLGTIKADGTTAVGRYNPFTRSIRLNSRVNWFNPASTVISSPDGLSRGDLLLGNAQTLGVASMSASQYMDLTILHELSHFNGVIGNPDKVPSVEKSLWWDCIQ